MPTKDGVKRDWYKRFLCPNKTRIRTYETLCIDGDAGEFASSISLVSNRVLWEAEEWACNLREKKYDVRVCRPRIQLGFNIIIIEAMIEIDGEVPSEELGPF